MQFTGILGQSKETLSEGMEQSGLTDSENFLQGLFRKHVTSSMVSMFGAMASIMSNSLLAGIFFGTPGLAVMSIVAPFYLLFSAFGSLVGVGGSTATAFSLGRDKQDEANEAFTLSVGMGILLPLAVGLLCCLGLDGILQAFGCTEELHRDAYDYSLLYLLGGFGTTLIYLPYSFLKLLGRLRALMFLFLGMAAANILLDIACVKALGMGIEGIAAGTVAASLGTAVIGILLLSRGKDAFAFVRPRNWGLAWNFIKLGTPPALNNLLSFLRILLLNRIVAAIAGQSGLAAFSVLTALENLSLVVLSGLAQATSGFVSVFTQEMDTVSVRRIEKQAFFIGFSLMLPLTVLLLLFPSEICRLFGMGNGEDLRMAAEASYIFAFSLLPSVCCFLLFFYYQAAGFTVMANALILCRSFLFLVLPAWILASSYGLEGVWWSFVIASISPLFVLPVALPYYFRRGCKGVLLQKLQAERSGTYLSFAMEAKKETIVDSVDRIEAFCEKNGLTPKENMLLRLSMEEMLISITEHCFPENSGEIIDLRILLLKNKEDLTIILRIRNGGRLFNPIDYAEQRKEEDPLAMGDALGISMVEKAADAIHYKTTFGVNNLTILIDR